MPLTQFNIQSGEISNAIRENRERHLMENSTTITDTPLIKACRVAFYFLSSVFKEKTRQ